MNDWIKVTDRLPEHKERVLYSDGDQTFIAEYQDTTRRGTYFLPTDWYIYQQLKYDIEPLFWMPLPVPSVDL